MREGTRFHLAFSLAGLVLLAALPAVAQSEGDDDGFRLRLDPAVFGAYFSDSDTNSSKFEEYRDVSDGAVMPRFDLRGETKDGNGVFKLLAENVRRADAHYRLSWNQSGSYALMFDYNLIPHRFGNDGRLILTQTDADRFEFSSASQRQLQSALEAQRAINPAGVNFAFLDQLLQPYIDAAASVSPEINRERMRARVDLGKMGRFAWAVQLDHENRSGGRPYGASFGFSNVVEIPEPIDYDTTGVDLFGEWKGDRSGVRAGYVYNRFENHIDSVLYDNPFRAVDSTDPSAYQSPGSGSINGPVAGRNALAPDNTLNQVYVTGNSKIGDNGFFNGRFSYGSMSQDAELLPYSTNTAINASTGAPFDVTDATNLPESHFDGKAKVANLQLNGGVRFAGSGSLKGHYRLYDYNNDSGQIELPGYVRFDAAWEAIGRINVPYEYRRQNLGVDFGWDLTRSGHLEVSYSHDFYDRSFREIEDADEDVFKVTFDTRAIEHFLIRASFEHGSRDIGEYSTEAQELSFTEPEGINNQPDLRKYDEAARDYNQGGFFVQVSPTDRWDLSFGLNSRKEDYDESVFGLVEDNIWRFNVDANYEASDEINLYVFGHRADRESFQRARQSGGTLSTNPADDWELTLDEVTDTWGGGITANFAKGWTADVSGQWNRAEGDSEFFSPPGGTPDSAASFDEYDDNEFWTFAARLLYNINRHVAASAAYSHERYTADRFARDGLDYYLPSALLLNGNDGDYEADIFATYLHIKF